MKKIVSILLCCVMLVGMIAAMGLTVSAKTALEKTYAAAADGDLLYELTFGETTGVYQSKIFADYTVDFDLDVKVTDAGRTLTAEYPTAVDGDALYDKDAKAVKWFYGDSIEGLTVGNGEKYTFKCKVFFPKYIPTGKTDYSYGNAGVYVNFPKNEDATYLYDTGYKYVAGYYGTADVRHTMSFGAGGKMAGKYLSTGNAYATTNLATRDADGFVDMAVEIDGVAVRVYFNNVLIDETDIFSSELASIAGNLGFSVYLYNLGAKLIVKDVNLYKGNTVKAGATVPAGYDTTGALAKTYSAAKWGDTLYKVDFTSANSLYNAMDRGGNALDSFFTVTESKDSVQMVNKGTAKGCYYGGAIEGLFITDKTEYTTTFKIKNSANGNTGFAFAMPLAASTANVYNIYGDFTFSNPSIVGEHGSTKIKGAKTDGAYQDITPFIDADGFASVKVEMKGYVASVYYLNAESKWTLLDSYDMSSSVSADGETTYKHDAGLQVAAMFYIHNKDMDSTVKDVVIEKGLTLTGEAPKTGDSAVYYAGAGAIALLAVLGMGYVSKKRVSVK